jgi:uncharacterized protein (TIGR00251 family)
VGRVALSLPEPGQPRQVGRRKGVGLAVMPALVVEQRAEGVRIRVRVKPRASKSRIIGVREGMLEVALAAPPVDGAANSELIYALAAALGRGKSTIEIVSGAASRSKLVAIAGLTEAELLTKLGQ